MVKSKKGEIAPNKTTETVVAPAPLTNQQIAKQNQLAKATHGMGITHNTKNQPIKGLASEPLAAKPQRRMLRYVTSMVSTTRGGCTKRYHLYNVGDSLLHAKVTEGLCINDLTHFADYGFVTLAEPSDAIFKAACDAWAASPPAEAGQAVNAAVKAAILVEMANSVEKKAA